MTTTALVLAAGKGTRLRSRTPKVLHRAAGRTLLGWVLHTLAEAKVDHVVVVVGHGSAQVATEAEQVAATLGLGRLSTVVQAEQRGTGHAVRVALEAGALDGTDEVMVLPGDVPGITAGSLTALREARGGAVAVMTAVVEDPTGYGRILRGEGGRVLAIVEHPDADAEQRRIREINAGLFAFRRDDLADAVGRLGDDNAQGEEYLTDTLALLSDQGVDALIVPAEEVAGVNDRAQLADVSAGLRARIVRSLQLSGVTVIDPATTYIHPDVVVEPDATILPGTMLEGRTTVAAGAVVGPHSRLVDTTVGPEATVSNTVATEAVIGARATVGPFTHLRPGTVLHDGSKAGGFVEMKKATIGAGSKVPHLSYIGDAELGSGVNVGAGTITCNYDGTHKHRTVVGDGAFIGSDTMLVAPVEIGPGAYTGAGSTVTTDVPADALAVERADLRVVEGWAARRRTQSEG